MCNIFKIESLLHKLPLNRAAGKDGIFAEHLSYADLSVCNHLSSLFSVCLMNSKIPQECMQTVIVPICKNKNGNISDAGNYRPVSLATIISKLYEYYILSCISPLLATTDNQFGFKPKHGTDMCIFLLKQTVSYYVNKETPVFSAFLDASKAFDRTNHNLLFAKLIKRNVPMCIVRLFLSWYRQQTKQVRLRILLNTICRKPGFNSLRTPLNHGAEQASNETLYYYFFILLLLCGMRLALRHHRSFSAMSYCW